MKMMQGACFLPCSNRSRTRLAPTPTNISTKSDPEMEKKGTPASPAMARASSVFPVPGDPMRRTPLGMCPPSLVNFFGSLRKAMISSSSSFASSMPATSAKVTLQYVPLPGGRGDVASLDRRVELARVDLLRLRGTLLGEDGIEREEEQDQDCPEKKGLVRLSHLGSSSGLGSIVAEQDSCRRLDGNGPSEGFISGRSRKEMPPLPHAGPGRSPSTQKIRPWASARSARRARCSRGMRASIQRSATFFVRPAAGRKRSPGRRPRSVHGNGAFETSTSTPAPPIASTSSTREAHR